ncbi:hypothetical protein FHG87_005007 [Trinorchestia longiramus]|nr:hypothetical protein FHG87_005007 [Trinorchestia longiramus]
MRAAFVHKITCHLFRLCHPLLAFRLARAFRLSLVLRPAHSFQGYRPDQALLANHHVRPVLEDLERCMQL